MSLVYKEHVKTFINHPESDTDLDFLIDMLIPGALKLMENETHREFLKSAVTEYHKGGSKTVLLKKPPIDTGESIIIYADANWVYSADYLVDPSDYSIDPDSGIVYFNYEIEEGPRVVKASYTGGWLDQTFPKDLIDACCMIIEMRMKEGKGGELGVRSRTIPQGGMVVFVQDDVPPQAQGILEHYRL